ncbi:MAG: ATP-dependent Clp protease proteolytic subunit [Planctomycetota bacterium]
MISIARYVGLSALGLGVLLTAAPRTLAAEAAVAETATAADNLSGTTAAPTEAAVSAETRGEASESATASKEEAPDPALQAIKDQLEKLKLESQLRSQQLEAQLAAVKAENQKLQLDLQLEKQKQQQGLQPLQHEKTRLELEAGLEKAKRQAAAAPADAELAELQRQQRLQAAQLAAELAEIKRQTQKIQAEQALAAAQQQAELAQAQFEQQKLSLEQQSRALKLQTAQIDLQAQQTAAKINLALTQTAVNQHNTQQALDHLVKEELVYRDEPFQDGVLYVTDRRISLNGPIIIGTADYVCDRIDYFNNQDPTKPIFLMIDNCPGGSVMQGYRIVKSIEASDAPVHVVVKSFAASMAAIITTLADHSYAYPNAILLHHQMSAGAFGNMTDIEEQVETLQEWEARLAVPVAEKMGITLDEFKKRMYENKASGDWDEFADRALELKWVNNIVQEVREEGVRKRPTGEAPRPWYYAFLSQDSTGQSYIALPPPEPMDAYMMYNPQRFFRVDGR